MRFRKLKCAIGFPHSEMFSTRNTRSVLCEVYLLLQGVLWPTGETISSPAQPSIIGVDTGTSAAGAGVSMSGGDTVTIALAGIDATLQPDFVAAAVDIRIAPRGQPSLCSDSVVQSSGFVCTLPPVSGGDLSRRALRTCFANLRYMYPSRVPVERGCLQRKMKKKQCN